MDELINKLGLIRDGWLSSVKPEGLVPGPFLAAVDIAALETSTGWTGAHLAEAVRRAFFPFDDEALAAMADRSGIGAEAAVGSRGAPGSCPGPDAGPDVSANTGTDAEGRNQGHPAGPSEIGSDTCPEVRPDNGSNEGRRLLAILAGRVPALAAKVFFHAACAGFKVTLKASAAEPVFATLLARSAETVIPGLVSIAPSARDELLLMVREAPVCLVYGSDETVAAVTAERPGMPTLSGPHMESFAVVFAGALASKAKALDIAAKIAMDTAIYDQSGCLSPVAVLVQKGGAVSPSEFGRMLVDAMTASPFKPGQTDADAITPARLFVQEISTVRGRNAVMTGPDGIPPAVVMVDRLRPCPGMRTLQVAEFDAPGKGGPDVPVLVPDLSDYLPGLAGRVQGMAVAGSGLETTLLLNANPDFRPNHLCRPGRLQDPPAMWPENGIILSRELTGLV